MAAAAILDVDGTLAVLTGGFGAAELRAAGAMAVYESVGRLAGNLDATLLS